MTRRLSSEFIDDVQDTEGPAVVGAILHEVIAPYMLREFRPQAHNRTIGQPQSTAFGLFCGYLQPFLAPDALHTLVIDQPAFIAQQSRHSAVAIAAVLAGQRDDALSQDLLVTQLALLIALCRPRLSKFRHVEHPHHLLHCLAPPGRAETFFESTSFRIPVTGRLLAASGECSLSLIPSAS